MSQAVQVVEQTTSTPAVTTTNEWSMIQEQAAIMARTEVVPKAYRGKPDDIIASALMGRELGFGLATSMRLIDVIEGNPELNAEGKLALIRSRGHSVQQVKLDDNGCTLVGKRADNGDELEVSFTWAEAERITFPVFAWSGPRDNRTKTRTGETRLVDKDNWQNYRQDMLWSRCVSRLGRRLFGDVLQGFSYDRDEIETFAEIDPDPPTTPPVRLVRSRPVTDDGEIIVEEEPETASAPPTDVIDVQVVDDGDGIEPEPEEPLSPAQGKYLEKLLGEAGIAANDRDGRHNKVAELIGRRVTTLSRLSKREASKAIDALSPKK